MTSTLSRQEIAELVSKRQGVIYGGRIITNPSQIPSEAEIAAATGDASAKKEASDGINAEIERLKLQLALLKEEKDSKVSKGTADTADSTKK